MYGESRARAAEYWGEAYAPLDRYLIAQDAPARAQAWYRQQSPQMQANLDGFAAGINAYIAAHPDHVPAELKRVLPLSGVDVMAHAHRLMQFFYVAPMNRVMLAEAPVQAPAGGAVVPATAGGAAVPALAGGAAVAAANDGDDAAGGDGLLCCLPRSKLTFALSCRRLASTAATAPECHSNSGFAANTELR